MDDIDDGLTRIAAEMPRCDAERHGAELYGAPRFSVFTLFGDRETVLSRILADLFDLDGSHGQGLLFVNTLLTGLNLDPISRLDRNVSVQTEAPVPVDGSGSPRRIDILIETATTVLGIENKKCAGESENQLGDYLAHIKRICRGRKPVLVFISDDAPSTSEAFSLPYHGNKGLSVDSILADARPFVKASRIHDFIDDFRSWIGRTFAGEEDDAMAPYADTFLDILKADRTGNRARAIGAILVAQDQICRNYVQEIEDHIIKQISDVYPDIEKVADFDQQSYPLDEWIDAKDEAWKIRRPIWPKNCYLAIESERGDWERLFYGVAAFDPRKDDSKFPKFTEYHSEKIDEITDAVRAYSVEGKATDWWRWRRNMPTQDWTTEAIGAALLKGESFPGDRLQIDRVVSDFIGLAKAISATCEEQ